MNDLLDKVGSLSNRIGRVVEHGAYGGAESLRKAKAEYDAKGRFQKLRIWIILIFIVDVVGTVGFVASGDSAAGRFEAWFQPGFPSNMVVVRNLGQRSVDDVMLVLDGQFRTKVATLQPGPTGLQIDTEFRDGIGGSPPDSYLPKRLEIRTADRLVAEVKVVPNRESL